MDTQLKQRPARISTRKLVKLLIMRNFDEAQVIARVKALPAFATGV
jgi:hypothetical protein